MRIRSHSALLALAAYSGLILANCSQPAANRSDTSATADDNKADGANDALKKPVKEKAKKTEADPCASGTGTLTAKVSGTAQPLNLDDDKALPTTQTGTDSGTATGAPAISTPPVSTDCPTNAAGGLSSDLGTGVANGNGTLGTGNGSGTTMVTGTGPGSGTTATATGPSLPPAGLLIPGKTLAQCNAEGKAWVPSSTGDATCGDPLVTWCCSMAEVANEFPAYASQLTASIQSYESSGRKLYHCAYANSKFTMYFVKSSGGSLSFASSYLVGVTPAPKAAPTKCALPTAASLGL